MADTTDKQATTQEAVQQQTVDGKAATGKPPQKPSTGDSIEQSASDSSSQKQSSQNQDAVSGRQRHGTNERAAAKGGDAPSSTGTNDTTSASAVNGSAKAHTASPDDSAPAGAGRTTPQKLHADHQQSSAGAANGSGSKKRSAAESSSSTENGRRSRNSDVAHDDPESNGKSDLAAPGTKDDAKRAKIGDPVVLGGESDKGPTLPSGKGSSGLGSAVDTNTTPDLSKPPARDAGESKPIPAVGGDATSGGTA